MIIDNQKYNNQITFNDLIILETPPTIFAEIAATLKKASNLPEFLGKYGHLNPTPFVPVRGGIYTPTLCLNRRNELYVATCARSGYYHNLYDCDNQMAEYALR